MQSTFGHMVNYFIINVLANKVSKILNQYFEKQNIFYITTDIVNVIQMFNDKEHSENIWKTIYRK